jgi:hypothetical protein
MNILAINAKLGDGHLRQPHKNASALFNGKNVEWITFKRDVAIRRGFRVTPIKPSYSGYKDDWSLVTFSVKTDKRLTTVHETDRIEVLKNLRKIDLILWFIDDGSWHKTRRMMHLYCNDLNEEEVDCLVSRIEYLYKVAPTIRQDRKKDGRSYPYLYLPRSLTNKFWRDVRRFVKWNELHSLAYKVGETSETIRNGVAFKKGRSGELPLVADDIVRSLEKSKEN